MENRKIECLQRQFYVRISLITCGRNLFEIYTGTGRRFFLEWLRCVKYRTVDAEQ